MYKLDIRVAGEVVDALSIIVPRRRRLEVKGLAFVNSLKELIPRRSYWRCQFQA